MHKRNKRSISSCSIDNKHHSSLISLASDENVFQQKVKRYEYGQIQKRYIIPVYNMIHSLESKQNINGSSLNQCRKVLKGGMLRLRQYNKQIQYQVAQIQGRVKEKQKQVCAEVQKAKISFQEEMRMLEDENNQNIMNLNAEFGKKQQQYRQITSKSLNVLSSIRKKWNVSNKLLISEAQNLYQNLQNILYVDEHNVQVYEKIVQFTDKVLYGDSNRENYNEEDDEFLNINQNMNFHEEQSFMEKLKQNSGREKVDSSLERICDEDEEFEDNGENDDFEVCMSKMICYGLFCEENRKYINKIIEITQSINTSILQSGIYPIILQGIKQNINKQIRFEEEASNGEIVMRDISNMQDFPIVQNHEDKIIF